MKRMKIHLGKRMNIYFGIGVILALLVPSIAHGQQFKAWEGQIAKYKKWVHLLRSDQYRYWTKLDSTIRPHKLYVGEGFYKADNKTKKNFVEIFSHYLAGHPEKFVLIDLIDSSTGKTVGEFGFGGYRLFKAGVKRTKAS